MPKKRPPTPPPPLPIVETWPQPDLRPIVVLQAAKPMSPDELHREQCAAQEIASGFGLRVMLIPSIFNFAGVIPPTPHLLPREPRP